MIFIRERNLAHSILCNAKLDVFDFTNLNVFQYSSAFRQIETWIAGYRKQIQSYPASVCPIRLSHILQFNFNNLLCGIVFSNVMDLVLPNCAFINFVVKNKFW